MPGPVPKRSEERRRVNKPDRPVDRVAPAGPVEVPPVPDGLHEMAHDWYVSLASSGQSVFYQPSDWAQARIVAQLLSTQLNAGGKSSSMMWTVIADCMRRDLLSSEGARRVARLEVERGKPVKPAAVSVMNDYRDALGG